MPGRTADCFYNSPAMSFDTLTIVGVGLIGGSVGLAARERGLARRVVGVGRSAESLWAAKARGAIDEAVTDVAAGAADADLVVVCTPVNHVAGHVFEAARTCRTNAILTDAGSTKAEIVRAVEANLDPGKRFVGGHPLAGSEKAGPGHARADLFDGRLVVLTPTQHTDRDALATVARFWEDLGARVK